MTSATIRARQAAQAAVMRGARTDKLSRTARQRLELRQTLIHRRRQLGGLVEESTAAGTREGTYRYRPRRSLAWGAGVLRRYHLTSAKYSIVRCPAPKLIGLTGVGMTSWRR